MENERLHGVFCWSRQSSRIVHYMEWKKNKQNKQNNETSMQNKNIIYLLCHDFFLHNFWHIYIW